MKKHIVFLLFSLSISVFVSAQEMPGKELPIKFGKKLLYLNATANKAANSTELDIDVYNQNLNKETVHKITIDGFAAKYCSMFFVFDQIPGSEWIEIALREKMLSFSGTIVRVNASFEVVGKYTYDSDAGKHLELDKLAGNTLNFIPMEHFGGGYLNFGYQELDAPLADGSRIYLNYDMSNISSSMSGLANDQNHGDVNAAVMPTTLCYFQANDKNFTIKWKLNIKDKHIHVYKVYLFGNDLFLYTSYFINGTTEQMIRKIDVNSGTVIYEIKMPMKTGSEFMLSAATYDNVNSDLVFCGNYMTTLPDKDQKKSMAKLSTFFIGKIDVKGICTVKNVDLTADRPVQVQEDYANAPFLCVKELHLNKNGQYVAVGQYNYQLPKWFSYNEVGLTTLGGEDMNIYKILTVGLSDVVFDKALNVTAQETNMFEIPSKNLGFVGFESVVPEMLMLGTKACNKWTSLVTYYDAESESAVVAQVNLSKKMNDKTESLYVLKMNMDKKNYFKAVGDVPSSDKNYLAGLFLLDFSSLIYLSSNQNEKMEATKIDLSAI